MSGREIIERDGHSHIIFSGDGSMNRKGLLMLSLSLGKTPLFTQHAPIGVAQCGNLQMAGPKRVLRQLNRLMIKDGGGTVVVPPGVYMTGTIYLVDNLELHLMPGAVLKGSPDRNDYNRDDIFPENNVFESEEVSGAHLIIGHRCTNVAITGQGSIDGNSAAFLDYSSVPPSDVYRGRPGH